MESSQNLSVTSIYHLYFILTKILPTVKLLILYITNMLFIFFQSPYFNSMFNGAWVETSQKEITIGIEDENISPEGIIYTF